MDTWLDFYNSRYFCMQKNIGICIGVWPYHAKRKYAYCFWSLLVIFLCGPQILAIKVNFDDPGKLMEHGLMTLVQSTVFAKLFTIIIRQEKMKVLYDRILENWSIISDPIEKDILIEYSERGRFLSIGYLSLQASVFVAFSFVPLIPMILDAISAQSVPRPRISVLHGEYLFEDPESHYAFTSCWEVLQVFCVLAIGGPIDTIYLSSTEHCLGLYAIVRHRLLKLSINSTDSNVNSDTKDGSARQIIQIIQIHQLTLESTETLQDGYSLNFFIMICSHLLIIPLICVLILRSFDNPINLFRYGMFILCALVHLFNIFWPGQKLINHSDEVLDAAVCNEWYTCSTTTKRLLNLFMLRCLEPPLLNGGGLMLLNFENYMIIVKTAASYITVFSSFQ